MQLNVSNEYLDIFQVLASSTRIKMIELLGKEKKNISEISTALGISSAIVTRHIQKLEKAGIVKSEKAPGKSGLQKIVSLAVDTIEIHFPEKVYSEFMLHSYDLKIGHYTDFSVTPTCGLATASEIVGKSDAPKFFMDTKRVNAELLWFSKGFVEYKIPNLYGSNDIPKMIEISLELASEFPVSNNIWPSDIAFYVNDIHLGTFTVSGNYSDVRGRYTPRWWDDKFSQYGVLKHLRITELDTGLDGQKLSDMTLKDLKLNENQLLTFRIAVEDNAEHIGGLTLFGEHFGNHEQNIKFDMYYEKGQVLNEPSSISVNKKISQK